VAIERHQTHQRSQAVSQESDLYLTRLPGDRADAATLALISRGHWGIANRPHHKRDVALGEEACRTRKAAQTLAAWRNLLPGFLHVCGVPVLRSLRRFALNPMPLYRWLI
jgi:hypothetical protein